MSFPDEITWARRVNDRWIVRDSLRKNAASYLNHLAKADPVRLRLSCRRAQRLTDQFGNDEDPKPWFYAALFSLATVAEAERFLTEHNFTLAAIPGLSDATPGLLMLSNLAGSTSEKILRIRESLDKLGPDD